MQPELLDYLGVNDPAARASRRDLRIINAVMGNDRWLLRMGRSLARPAERMLELGAGDGRVASRLAAGRCDALDLQPAPPQWPASARWHQADIREFDRWQDYRVFLANLFLHHLSDEGLSRIGLELRQHARVIVACEPVRSRRCQWLFAALCPLIGAHGVTRHDGRVSIGAGFRGDELARLLGLRSDEGWDSQATETARGAYRFWAIRR